jgi:hypothetical protein
MKGGTMSRQGTFSPNSALSGACSAHTPASPAAAAPPAAKQVPRAPAELAAAFSAARRDLWARTGGGLAFILAGTLLWTGLGIVGLTRVDPRSAALAYVWATGLVFPLALLLGRVLGHDVLTRANPLGMLGASLSGLQALFFPVLLWAYLHQPPVVPWFLGALTGAHFLPFGWLYGSRAYVVGAGLAVAVAAGTGFAFPTLTFVLTPFAMAAVFGLTALLVIHQTRRAASQQRAAHAQDL